MTPDGIKALRLKLGWTQARLAEELGCRRATVVEWESGKRTPLPPYARAVRRLMARVAVDPAPRD